jgi:hypothetical protein
MLLLCACMSAAFADQLYKWVDEQGHVHYSQTPPSATKAKPMDVTPTAADPSAVQRSQDLQQQQAQASQMSQITAARQAQTDAQKQAQLQQYCDNLKARLALYQQSGRVFRVDANGNRTYVSDADHDKAMQQMQDQIKAQCSAPH